MHPLLAKLRALFRRKNLEAEMAEEMRQHLERRIQEKIADGLTSQEARYAAEREFGGIAQVQEQCRDERRFVWLEQTFRDVHFAVRSLRKTPGFTAIALVTLALGIGANTSMFSLLNALLFRTPYPDDARLVRIYRTSPQSQSWPHSPANFYDVQAQNTVFAGIAAVNPGTAFNLAEPGQPAARLRGMMVTADFFPLLGVQPQLGRFFTAEEDQPGKNNVLLISHATWLHHFGGAPDVLGRQVRLDGRPVTIIGVMPERFDYPIGWGHVEAWRPFAFSERARQMRDNNFFSEVARLKPGVTLAQAQAEMSALGARLAAEYPAANAQTSLRLVPLARSDEFSARIAWFVAGLAGFVLLIACANLANLQFARHAARAREQAIRAALGASRASLIRGVLAESLLLSLTGGTLGLLVAFWCNDAIGRRFLVYSRDGLAVPLDGKVLAFAFVLSAVTAFVFGALPAWISSRAGVSEALKQGARGSTASRSTHRLRHALIVAEVALALVLMAGAGFFVRGVERFLQRDHGWRADGLVTGYINLAGRTYNTSDKRLMFFERLQEKLAVLPGVERAAIGWMLPTWGFGHNTGFLIESRARPAPGTAPLMYETSVSPDYFDALGLPLVAGRHFAAADRADKPAVAIINETMARTFWPGENPLGQRIGYSDDLDKPEWREVVGVVRDAGTPAFIGEVDTRFQAYRPLAQVSVSTTMALALRTSLALDVLAPAVCRAAAEIDPEQTVYEIGPVRGDIDRRLSGPRLAGDFLAGFAFLGLLLAAIGIYGVISGFVVQRTNEIGLRLALGAQVNDILALVFGRGLRLALLGTALGLVGAWSVAQLLRAIAPGLPPADFATTSSVTLALLAIAAFACWLPARRATKVDPMVALRVE
jgi:putative ABC transport system permease protein